MMLRAQTSKVDITPPVGIELSGFLPRRQPSTGVHDPLFIRALYLAKDDMRLLWLHSDLIGLTRSFVSDVRSSISKASGMPPERIILTATHTHAGPATIRLRSCGDMDPEYLAGLKKRFLEAAQKATAAPEEVRCSFGEGESFVGVDRRPFGGQSRLDPRLPILAFRRPDGSFKAIIANYGMHNVGLDAGNRLISADIAGVVAETASGELQGEPLVLFTNGCCGNINPPELSNDFDVAQRLGINLAKDIVRIVRKAATCQEMTLAAAAREVTLPLNVLSKEDLKAQFETVRTLYERQPDRNARERGLKVLRQWRDETLALLHSGKAPKEIITDLQAVRIGPACFVFIGAEVFSTMAEELRRAFSRNTYVVGLANDYIGYLPPEDAYSTGGYETDEAHIYGGYFPLAAGAYERIREEAIALLCKLPA